MSHRPKGFGDCFHGQDLALNRRTRWSRCRSPGAYFRLLYLIGNAKERANSLLRYLILAREKSKTLALSNLFLRAPVAQLDRVLDYESSGRRFDSFPARHFQFGKNTPQVKISAQFNSALCIDTAPKFLREPLQH